MGLTNRKNLYVGTGRSTLVTIAGPGRRGTVHYIDPVIVIGQSRCQIIDGAVAVLLADMVVPSGTSGAWRDFPLNLRFADGLTISSSANDGFNIVYSLDD